MSNQKKVKARTSSLAIGDLFPKALFGDVIESRNEVIKEALHTLHILGYEVLDRRGKNHGKRLWFLLKRDGRVSVALLVLESVGEEGWVTKWFHEDHGIPRLNCPLAILRKLTQNAKTKKARQWRQMASCHMEEYSTRSKLARKDRSNNPKFVISEQMKQRLDSILLDDTDSECFHC